MKNFIYKLIVIGCSLTNLRAEKPQDPILDESAFPRDISHFIHPIIQQYDIPGMVAVIIHNNGIVAAGAAGVRVRGASEPLPSSNNIQVTDKFHLGSCTKAMTATLCAKLIEEGVLRRELKFNWDSKIVDVNPSIAANIYPLYRPLTIRQILNHRGGLPRDMDFYRVEYEAGGDIAKARFLVGVETLSYFPAVAPGYFNYSGVGYVIVGQTLETVNSISFPGGVTSLWEQLITKNLFEPLRMKSAGFRAPPSRDRYNMLINPQGHSSIDGKPIGDGPSADNAATAGPAGTVHCSILDWAKFVNVHLKGAQGDARFISLDSYNVMHTPVPDSQVSYAMGWYVTTDSGIKGNILWHTGSNGAWYSLVALYPYYDIAILICCNYAGPGLVNGGNACNDLQKILFNNQVPYQLKSLDHKPEIQLNLPLDKQW